eukprot:Opistho-2@54102
MDPLGTLCQIYDLCMFIKGQYDTMNDVDGAGKDFLRRIKSIEGSINILKGALESNRISGERKEAVRVPLDSVFQTLEDFQRLVKRYENRGGFSKFYHAQGSQKKIEDITDQLNDDIRDLQLALGIIANVGNDTQGDPTDVWANLDKLDEMDFDEAKLAIFTKQMDHTHEIKTKGMGYSHEITTKGMDQAHSLKKKDYEMTKLQKDIEIEGKRVELERKRREDEINAESLRVDADMKRIKAEAKRIELEAKQNKNNIEMQQKMMKLKQQ